MCHDYERIFLADAEIITLDETKLIPITAQSSKEATNLSPNNTF